MENLRAELQKLEESIHLIDKRDRQNKQETTMSNFYMTKPDPLLQYKEPDLSSQIMELETALAQIDKIKKEAAIEEKKITTEMDKEIKQIDREAAELIEQLVNSLKAEIGQDLKPLEGALLIERQTKRTSRILSIVYEKSSLKVIQISDSKGRPVKEPSETLIPILSLEYFDIFPDDSQIRGKLFFSLNPHDK